jgi:hypothetical protein
MLVHAPAQGGELPAHPAVVEVAAAGARGVVDALGEDDVNLAHSGRS